MSDPKRHHYLPQSYLERFCEDGRLWLFDRMKNEYRHQTPVNTAVEKDFYTVRQADGTKDNGIEKWLSSVEGAAKPIVERLIAREQIDFGEKVQLAQFVALMQTRTPEFKAQSNAVGEMILRDFADAAFGTPQRAAEVMAQYERETGKKAEVSPVEISEYYNNTEFDVTFAGEVPLEHMLDISTDVTKVLAVMNWRVMHTPKRTTFVTCDSPFVILPTLSSSHRGVFGLGVATPGAVKMIPLASSLCLLVDGPGDNIVHVDASRDGVRAANLEIARRAFRFVISRDRAHVKSLVERLRLCMAPEVQERE